MTKILGISAFYHDSAAAIIEDGQVLYAAQEERFTRKKNDSSFPINAIRFILKESKIDFEEIEAVAFYDKPFLKFERLLETYHTFAPKGLKSFLSAMPVWVKEKIFMKRLIRESLSEFADKNVIKKTKIFFPEHHLSHAASAFYPSPFNEAAILTIDGVGEWATTAISHGRDKKIKVLSEIHFPHSLGLLYSAFTYYCGFKVNSGEYKLMGLAPYGNPDSEETKNYIASIKAELIDIRKDGSFSLNMKFFNYATGLEMCVLKEWEKLFNLPKRTSEGKINQSYMNLALAIQVVTEEVVLKLAQTAKELTNSKYLVLAGGVALNCVANGKLLQKKIFDDIWIQPAAGDSGGSLGAALACYHIAMDKPRIENNDQADLMRGSYLGPSYDDHEVERYLKKFGAKFQKFEKFDQLTDVVSEKISKGNVVGWFQGRLEWGPRALGNRSILGDSRFPDMQKKLNLKIKYREGFRPFAPSVLEEDRNEYFDLEKDSPYMLLVSPVKGKRRTEEPKDYSGYALYDRLYHLRSDVPAITHIDYSARVQTVSQKTNKRYWKLIKAYKEKTGFGLLVNTSFNVRGEPIVCSPMDAYLCFMRTEMDYLVIGNYYLEKVNQPVLKDQVDWKNAFALD
tara:strand:+ start:416 stop:2287 length:1872 start_codon:yes stop_codon:yes gene_type:complete